MKKQTLDEAPKTGKETDDNKTRAREKYLDLLYKAYYDTASQFDRTLEIIASGALLLSFAYMGHVVPYETGSYKWILVLSWGLLILTLIGGLSSHYHAISCHRAQIEATTKQQECTYRTYTDVLAYSCISSLLVALICMFVYVSLNIHSNEQKNTSSTQATTSGTKATSAQTTVTTTTTQTTTATVSTPDSIARTWSAQRRSAPTATTAEEEMISTHSKEDSLDSTKFGK